MAQQPFSVSVKYVGGLSGAQISDLSPFGSPNVSDPTTIANATFQPISLTSIVLDPDTYSVFDLISVRPHKGVNEVISTLDSISSFGVIKHFDQYVSSFDYHTFDLIKRFTDESSALDYNVLSFNKANTDTLVVPDSYALDTHKVYSDALSNVSDILKSLNFNKGVNDSVTFTDHITQQSLIKQLKDYANPIDYVGIPDGSTYQLVKTLRNTALATDSISHFNAHVTLQPDFVSALEHKTIAFNTSRNDVTSTLDTHTLSTNKFITNDVAANELHTLTVDKVKSDIAISSDKAIRRPIKSLRDSISLTDNKVLLPLLGKKDYAVLSDKLNYVNTNKVLKDYANPIDAVGIPDGSTFQLVKTLRNSVSQITDSVFVRSSFVKFLNSAQNSFDERLYFNTIKARADSQYTFDRIQHVNSIKVLKDYANPIDYVGIPDGSTFQLFKTISNAVTVTESIFVRRHIVRYLDDSIDSSLFNERLVFNIINAPKDNVGTSTSYPVFDLHAVLKDYANPVDAVGIPDGSTFALYKTLVNTVSNISDSFSKVVNFNRTFNNSTSVYDDNIIYSVILGKNDSISANEHAAFNATKVRSDQTGVSEYKILSAKKVLSHSVDASIDRTIINANKQLNNIVEPTEFKAWTFNKSVHGLDTYSASDNFSKIVNYVRHYDEPITSSELITQKTFDKVVKDNQYTADVIAQFTSHKLLKDYATPVDYVGIPDNSTFQLSKTIANFVSNITDNLTYRLDWVRYYNDAQVVSEKLSFNLNAHLNDSVSITDNIASLRHDIVSNGNTDSTSTSDLKHYTFAKVLRDTASQLDLAKLRTNIVKRDNVSSIFDKATSHIKPFKHDSVTTTEQKSFNAHLALSDGFNGQILTPLTADVDFEIAISSDIDTTVGFGTFDFQTGTNQYSKIFDTITHFNVNKHINDYANVTDYASIPDNSTFRLTKTVTNFVSTLDSIYFRSISYKRYADVAIMSDRQSKSTNKVKHDTTNAIDNLSRNVRFNRIFNDVVYTTDLANTTLRLPNNQLAIDNAGVTDELNRTVSYRRHLSDVVYTTDSATSSLKVPAHQDQLDTIGVNSSGVLYIQNYASELYFAEDYTGSSYTFV